MKKDGQSGNIVYRTEEMARHFSRHRVKWQQFYESERVIIAQLQLQPRHSVLDIGCGCGGLGVALRDQFGIETYTGVEINPPAAAAGRKLNPRAQILCGDILELSQTALHDRRFDVVCSLSCVDWNVRFDEMLISAWNHVLPGGYLVATFRLVVDEGCHDMERSFQYINFEGHLEGERAPYVVLNAKSLLHLLCGFEPSEINAFGYWGAPSPTAVTPYKKICFAAFSVRKRLTDHIGPPLFHLDLPAEIGRLDGLGKEE